ncbi:MAG: cyclic nucleotide-binding domain-containing protein [Thiotrichales bacterium]|nr:cyclic nucleotide-binding domain-containing protein [Thiotrichales bacterium]
MSAARSEMVDNAILSNLSPLNEMSTEHFNEVATRAKIKQFKKGEYLFREGHNDRHTFYLIKGRVALLSKANVVKTIDGATEEANSPLATDLPRKFTARVQSTSTIVMIDTTVLDFHLGKTTVDTYEVNDIHAGNDGDWMTRILQSEAFSKLPPINLQKMLSGVTEVAYETGDIIIEKGQQAEYYYIVKSGVCCESDNLTQEWHCGDAFGASGLVCNEGQLDKVIMKGSGELMLLPKADFLELCYEPLVKYTDAIGVQEQLDNSCKWLDIRSVSARVGSCIRDSIDIPLSELKAKLDSLNNFQAYIVVGETPEQSGVGAFFLMQHGLNAFSYNDHPSSLDTRYIDPHATPPVESASEKNITLELESEKLRLQEEVAALKATKLSLSKSNLGNSLSLVDEDAGNSIDTPTIKVSSVAPAEDNSPLLAEKSALEDKIGSLRQQLTSETEKRKLAENNYTGFLKKVKRYKLGNDALVKKLKTQLIEGKNKLTKLVSQSASVDTDISKVRTELDEKSSQLLNAEETLQEKISRINELEASLTQTRNDLDNVGQEFEASDDNEKVNILQEKLKTSSEEKRELEGQLKSITEDYEALQNERAEAALWDEMEDLHSALDDSSASSSNDLSDLSDMLDGGSDDDLNNLDFD